MIAAVAIVPGPGQFRARIHRRERIMGKGDKRTKRGKIFKGTFGKRRARPQKLAKKSKSATPTRP
jgi:ribosomal small subunit protein bTHX